MLANAVLPCRTLFASSGPSAAHQLAFCTLHSTLRICILPTLSLSPPRVGHCCCIVSCILSLSRPSLVSCLSPCPQAITTASSRTIPSQTTPSARSTDQLSRLCHPINRLRPPQTAPATITSHPSQHFPLSKQNRPWGYIDSAGWLLSVRSAKGYTFHTNQPLNLLLLLLPASPTIYPPLSALCTHMIFANQPFVHHNAPSPTLPLGLAYLACLAIALTAFVSR